MTRTFVLLFASLTFVAHAQESPERVLKESGVGGGLVAVVGCENPALLAGLRTSEAFTVVGLDTDPASIEKAREFLSAKKSHGPVTVVRWNGKTLPFTDNLVNLLVVAGSEPPRAEMERVLAPGGVAVFLNQPSETKNRKWVKPRPAEIDDWPQYLYDASNNALSKDTVVGPPKGLQWWAGPYSSRSHNWVPSTGAMVSSGGRLFYLRDEGPISAMPHKGTGMNWSYARKPMPAMPEEWSLIARDAFNGKELWRRPLEGFGHTLFEDIGMGPTAWNIWSLPLSVKRRLVATPERVYVTLAYRGGLSALDAATGKTIWDYKPEQGLVDEVIHDAGRIFVKLRREIPQKLQQPFYREGLDAAWGKAYTGEDYDKYVESQPPEMVAAIDAQTGRELWRFDAPRVGAETLCALDGAVAYYDGTHVVCRNAADGAERWRKPAEPYAKKGKYHRQSYYIGAGMGFLLLWNGHAFFSGGGGTTCYKLEDGTEIWKGPVQHSMGFGHPTAYRIVGGKIITEHLARVYDALTGAEVPSWFKEGPWGGTHGRCHRGVATVRYHTGIAFGIEFYDMQTGEMVSDDRWLRSECAVGYVPANGLLYHAPDPCACWLGGRIRGYEAFAPVAPKLDYDRVNENERLEKGPAFGTSNKPYKPDTSNWRTYRHDAQRSGRASCAVPAELKVAWRSDLGSPYDWRGHNIVAGLTPPTVAAGKVFVARKDAHEIVCLNAANGKTLWRYPTPAPVTSPPTIHEGLALFGCLDGSVYGLRAEDGVLAWRFRAAPADILTLFEGRPASKWPVPGAVLIHDGAAYVVAGHSSFLDGGIHFFKLNPATGKMLAHARAEGPRYPFHEQNPFVEVEKDPKWGHVYRCPDGYFPQYIDIEGHRADILVSDGVDLRMGQTRITPDLKVSSILREQAAGTAVKRRWLRPMHVFLDDTYNNRVGWHYSDAYYGGGNAAGAANAGKLLVFDDQFSYGAQWEGTDQGRYPNHLPGAGTRINADRLETANEQKGFDALRKDKPAWSVDVPLKVRSMVLADAPNGKGRILFVAGPVEKKPGEPEQLAPYRGLGAGKLLALSATDGKILLELDLPAQPIFDGMAAANGKLFLSLADGSVICLK